MKLSGTAMTLSKDIAKNSPSILSKMGNKKALMKKPSCRGMNDPCIVGGTVGKRLSELISK